MFDWKDYFKLAKELAKSKKESRLRSTVSRAYYAAFCTARNHAITLGYRTQGSGDHAAVPKFYASRNTQFPGVGQKLGRLRRNRNNCDYNDVVLGLSSKSQKAIMEANAILSQIP